jgi:spore cortex biosynthesis protein YabQ
VGISLSGQSYVFLLSCGFGVILGALYDLFRIFRLAIPCNKFIVFLQDIIYWVICTALTFAFMLVTSSGQIRGFIIFGELLGAFVYYFTIGMLVMKSSKFIIRVAKKILRFIFKILIFPFYQIWKLIRPILSVFKRKTKKTSKNIYNNAKFHLKQYRMMVYNLFTRKKKNKNI